MCEISVPPNVTVNIKHLSLDSCDRANEILIWSSWKARKQAKVPRCWFLAPWGTDLGVSNCFQTHRMIRENIVGDIFRRGSYIVPISVQLRWRKSCLQERCILREFCHMMATALMHLVWGSDRGCDCARVLRLSGIWTDRRRERQRLRWDTKRDRRRNATLRCRNCTSEEQRLCSNQSFPQVLPEIFYKYSITSLSDSHDGDVHNENT